MYVSPVVDIKRSRLRGETDRFRPGEGDERPSGPIFLGHSRVPGARDAAEALIRQGHRHMGKILLSASQSIEHSSSV